MYAGDESVPEVFIAKRISIDSEVCLLQWEASSVHAYYVLTACEYIELGKLVCCFNKLNKRSCIHAISCGVITAASLC